MTFSEVFGGALGAWSDYNKTQQEASKAEQAQQNYQASLNQATLAQRLSNNKTIITAIIGVGAVIVAYFIFKK